MAEEYLRQFEVLFRKASEDQLIPLSEYAVEGRYGVIHDDIDDAERYIALLQGLLEFVRGAVSKTAMKHAFRWR